MMGAKKERLLILHRHWMWANIMKQQFYSELGKQKDNTPSQIFFADKTGAYMCAWYGLFYGVIEEAHRMKLQIPGVDLLDKLWDKLRRFRNAVFHPQKEYWSPKFIGFVREPDCVSKIRDAHSAFGRFFLATLGKDRNK